MNGVEITGRELAGRVALAMQRYEPHLRDSGQAPPIGWGALKGALEDYIRHGCDGSRGPMPAQDGSLVEPITDPAKTRRNTFDDLLTRSEAAELLGTSVSSIKRFDERNLTKPVHLGRNVRYTRRDLLALIETLKGQ